MGYASETRGVTNGLSLQRPPRLFDGVRRMLRFQHYSLRTEKAYISWIRRFILANGKGHPRGMGAAEVERYRHIQWNKVFAFTQLRLARILDEGQRWLLAARLARKETTDYLPLRESTEESYRPFAAVTHVASVEGGAVLVEPTEDSAGVDFLRDFVGNTGSRAYLPLALWAYHDYLVLSAFMAETDGSIDFRDADAAGIAALKDFRARIYNYRFHFRFSHASTVTMHNEMFRRWRRAFDLQHLLEEVSNDVAEAESYLDARRSEQANELARRTGIRLTIAIAIVGVLIALPDWTGLSLQDLLALQESPWRERVVMAQLGIVAVFGVIAGWALWRLLRMR